MISSAPSDLGVVQPSRPFYRNSAMTPVPAPLKHSYAINTGQREKHISFIGDSHGNHAGFRKNMEALGYLVDQHFILPRNHHLVILGDILADRHTGGIPIILDIADICDQGGRLDLIAGNHEDLVISFLFGRPHENIFDPISFCESRNVGLGLQEFSRFQSKKAQSPWDLSAPDILNGLRSSPDGRRILKVLCNMKIGVQIDDTLFVHTDINDAMVKMILEYGIDTVNEIFQRNMRSFLMEGKEESDSALFHKIRDTFLSSFNSRETLTGEVDANGARIGLPNLSHISADNLSAKYGIHRIVHGHTDYGRYDNSGALIEDTRTIIVGGILITSVDHSAHKQEGYRDHARSVGCIDRKGTLFTYNN